MLIALVWLPAVVVLAALAGHPEIFRASASSFGDAAAIRAQVFISTSHHSVSPV
jgi:hypothetical protein